MPELPVLEGASATIQFDVGKSKSDLRTFHLVLTDGAVTDSTAGPAAEPDFTMAMPRPELDAVVAGDRTLDVGYMQGTVKVTGNVGRLLSVLPVLTTPAFTGALAGALDEVTD